MPATTSAPDGAKHNDLVLRARMASERARRESQRASAALSEAGRLIGRHRVLRLQAIRTRFRTRQKRRAIHGLVYAMEAEDLLRSRDLRSRSVAGR